MLAAVSAQPSMRVVNANSAPIFFSFFTWGFGTGAQNLGRPLFALAATGNVFLVGVLIAANALPRLVSGPLTGYLTDRLGRKPLVMLGPAIRGVSNVGQFFATDYATFFALEMVGQFGVAMWNTSANVLLSDVTTSQNRGKVLAVRHMSMRMGFVAGPLLGGVMAVTFGLQSVFLLNGLSKIIILLVAFFLVRETRPTQASAPAPAEGKRARSAPRFSLAPFRDPSFLALSVATAALSMTQAGTMQAVLPVHAKDALDVSSASLGFLISLAAALAFALALPNGVLSDRLGRKVSLVPGLALLGVSVLALAYGQAYGLLVLVVVLHGSGEAMTLGTTQTYAMDLAPSTARGAFMGLWSLSQSTGAVIGPLLASALYHWVGPAIAFQAVAGVLLVSAVVMLVMGRETAGPWARRPVDEG